MLEFTDVLVIVVQNTENKISKASKLGTNVKTESVKSIVIKFDINTVWLKLLF